MKIRNGFVSNSSTSSFCILGVKLPNKKIDELLDGKNLYHTLGKSLTYIEDAYNWDGDTIIGMHPYDNMEEDETKAEFRARIKAEIKKQIPGLEHTPLTVEIYEGECSE